MQSLWHIRNPGVLARWKDDLRAYGTLSRWGHRAEIDVPSHGTVQLIANGSVQAGSKTKLGRGDLFGLFDDEVQLRAFDDTMILRIAPDKLDDSLGELTSRVGVVGANVVKVPIKELLFTSDQARIASVLLRLVSGEDENAGKVELEIKARHLAQLTGLPLLKTRRIFRTLKEQSLVETGRNGLVIPDIAAMRAVLEDV